MFLILGSIYFQFLVVSCIHHIYTVALVGAQLVSAFPLMCLGSLAGSASNGSSLFLCHLGSPVWSVCTFWLGFLIVRLTFEEDQISDCWDIPISIFCQNLQFQNLGYEGVFADTGVKLFLMLMGGRASPSFMRRQGVTIFIYATLQHLQWIHLKVSKHFHILVDISLSWYSLLSWTTNLKSPAYTSKKCQTLKEHYEN